MTEELPHDTSDEPLREVSEWVRCSRCNQLTGVRDDDGKCPDCIAKTSNFGKTTIQRSPVHRHHPCGCTQKDGIRTAYCVRHLKESELVRAREREADDLRYRVRGLEKENKERRKEVHYRNHALEKARKERDEWKRKAEQAEMEYQDALQNGSICPDPDLHKGDTLDGWAASEIGWLQEELDAAKRAQQMTWDALDEEVQGRLRVERENKALQDAVKHLRGQVPDTRWCCYHNRQENHAGEAQE